VLLVIKVNALLLDILELVVLCMKSVNVSYDAGISKVIKGIVDNKTTGATGIEDGVIGVLDTRAMEIGGGECACVKGGTISGLPFTLYSLVNYPIIDVEVADVLGSTWSVVWSHENKQIVTGVGGVKTYPLATWVVSVLCIFSLGRNMGNFCWSGETVEEGRWGGVD